MCSPTIENKPALPNNSTTENINNHTSQENSSDKQQPEEGQNKPESLPPKSEPQEEEVKVKSEVAKEHTNNMDDQEIRAS